MEAVDDIDAQELSTTSVMYACYSLFVYYLQQDDVDTKCAALRALSSVFMSRPRVMLLLEQDGTIEDIMSTDSAISLQIESLQCWKEILLVSLSSITSFLRSQCQLNVFAVRTIGGREESRKR